VKKCTLRPKEFSSWKLKQIYSVIRSHDEKERPIDIISVVEELGPTYLKMVGGVSYITQLAGSVPTTVNFHFYEKLVKEKDQKRKTIQIAKNMIEQAKSSEIN
jgi:replicative DNA helicase